MAKNIETECVNSLAITELFGCFIKKTELIKEYPVEANDLVDPLHRIIYASIHNLYRASFVDMEVEDVVNYIGNLEGSRNSSLGETLEALLRKAVKTANPDNIKYYYENMKKYTLLRELDAIGCDISDFYNPQEINPVKLEEIYKNFENSSVEQIADFMRKKIILVTSKYVQGEERESKKAGGSDFLDKKEEWKKEGTWGLGYASAFMTAITHGMKKKTLTIASAPTGVGKTRTTISHMVHSCASEYYSKKEGKWLQNPHGANKALYIGTEMLLKEEIDPLITAYVADVPEGHIKDNNYIGDEEKRVDRAIMKILEDSNIYLEYMPNYTAADLEQVIEYHKMKHNIGYVYFDYIHSTPALVSEFTQASGGKSNIRDDQVLADLAAKLKNFARKYDVAILTCTQVNGEYKNTDNRDETIVRGAKAIIDKADTAYIITRPTSLEMEKLNAFLLKNPECFPTYYELDFPKEAKKDLDESGHKDIVRRRLERKKQAKTEFASHLCDKADPNLVYSIYKNRGGEFNRVKVWLYVDYSTMRTHDLFVTDYDYVLDADKVSGLNKTYLSKAEGKEGFCPTFTPLTLETKEED